ncbi:MULTISPECIES: zf-HC2 domain-containing protein [Bacillus]|uniref:Zinc-finger domain-containing protein n=2 Tax=Bacillus TaxID=1386 RepID=A0A0M4FV58_9BACI|nr:MULTISPECIES: zf-HC2 domain-containing protein [Bacillus]ALC82405.1 hypothetical protein AM592_13055 [Bacillus gobiensis]MBP1081285.1 hypothetical protein [Bacillus capparidis]MED1095964.1 zf-HC2 domain-containing protein [Bacillus capparidis]
MARFEDIHILCQELIPIYNELEEDAKRVIEKHAEECESCKEQLESVGNIEITPKEMNHNQAPMKRFKKLFLFKRVNTLLMFFIRVIVLGLIAFDFSQHFSADVPYGIQFEGLRASLVLFYIPLAFVLLMFTWFLKNMKLLLMSLLVDLLVIYFFDDLIRLIV